MYDPNTVAWEIKYPWWKNRPWPKGKDFSELPKSWWRKYHSLWKEGYRDTFITIWHKDPEKGRGGDGTCGWSSPQLTDKEMELIKEVSNFEIRYLWKPGENGMKAQGDNLTMVYSMAGMLAWRVWRRRIGTKEIPLIISLVGNFHDSFDFRQPMTGYDIERAWYAIARCLKREWRPWYRHPRWHVSHWTFQVHPWNTLRRFLLTRCEHCKKGFRWGAAPITSQWNSESPKFLRGEKALYHDECYSVNFNKPVPTPEVSAAP